VAGGDLDPARGGVDNGVVTRLADHEIDSGLETLPGWTRVGDEITREYRLPSFADAVAFVVQIGFMAEAADHHPDLDIRWRTVRIALSTHSEGGITPKDLELAGQIEIAAGRSRAE